jgi:hypothetical protein
METAIGVFSSSDHAEQAVRALEEHGVPQESIVVVTGSESDPNAVAEHFGVTLGAFMGMAVGMSTGVFAAALRHSSVESMLTLGFGAASLLGWVGACAGALFARAIARDVQAPPLASNEKPSKAAKLFRYALSEGRSLVVVRTEAQEIAAAACGVLKEAGGGM